MTNKEAIKYLIAPFATSTKSYNEYLKQKEAYDLAIKALEERPQGKWIDTGEKMENYGEWYRCSNCENTDFYGNFCPHCGADMRGKEE